MMHDIWKILAIGLTLKLSREARNKVFSGYLKPDALEARTCWKMPLPDALEARICWKMPLPDALEARICCRKPEPDKLEAKI